MNAEDMCGQEQEHKATLFCHLSKMPHASKLTVCLPSVWHKGDNGKHLRRAWGCKGLPEHPQIVGSSF